MTKQTLKFTTSPVVNREASDITWFSVSSETPCRTSMLINDIMQDCYLVLAHSPEAIDRQWIMDGIQLRDGHGGDVVAIAKPVTITNGKLGGNQIIWGSSERAKTLAADYARGVRVGVSVEGDYATSDLSLIGEHEGLPLVRASKWSCLAAALVAVPADPTVGVNRSMEVDTLANNNDKALNTEPVKEKRIMTAINVVKEKVARSGAESAEVFALARQYDVPQEQVAEWMTEGTDMSDIRGVVLRDYAGKVKTETKATPIDKIGQDSGKIGMSEKEVSRYSFSRAILAQLPGSSVDCSFEREASLAVARKFGKVPRGIYIPMDVLVAKVNRAMSVASGGVGGYLVSTDQLAGSFIDVLRSKMVLSQLGATFLPGLVGDVTVPKKSASVTGYWVADGDAPTESAMTLGQVKLTPHCAGAYVDCTRQLLQQSNPAIDALVQSDITESLARVLQAAAFHGSNAANQPKGLVGWIAANALTVGTDGSPTFAEIAAAEGMLEADNVDGMSNRWAMAPGGFAGLRVTTRDAGSGQFVGMVQNGQKYVADNPAVTTTSITSKYGFYGDFSNLLIGLWGALDLTIDPYSLSTSGGLRIVGLQDCDIAVRHAEAFAFTSKLAANA